MQEKKNKKANKKGGVRKEDLEMQQQKEKRNGTEMLSEYALSRLTYNCIWSAKKKRRKRKRRERERKKNHIYWKQKALTRMKKKKKSSRRVAIWKKKKPKNTPGLPPIRQPCLQLIAKTRQDDFAVGACHDASRPGTTNKPRELAKHKISQLKRINYIKGNTINNKI